MQVLIVHRDAELGTQLVQMVKEYSVHQCDFVRTDAAALAWATTQSRCDFLLTQLKADGVDGFALGGSLSERFPKLQTAFFPPYRASEQRLEIRETKVFPEPVDGERLLDMLNRAEAPSPNGSDVFRPVDILQMCCLSRKGGALQMVFSKRSGVVFLYNGKIVHAETDALRGPSALREIIGWDYIEFAYDSSLRPDAETISRRWEQVLIDAVKAQSGGTQIKKVDVF